MFLIDKTLWINQMTWDSCNGLSLVRTQLAYQKSITPWWVTMYYHSFQQLQFQNFIFSKIINVESQPHSYSKRENIIVKIQNNNCNKDKSQIRNNWTNIVYFLSFDYISHIYYNITISLERTKVKNLFQ